jgi:hypothetical protein
MILIVSQRKQSTQEIKKHTCVDVCSKGYYILPKTLETKCEGGVDIDNVNVKHGRNSS